MVIVGNRTEIVSTTRFEWKIENSKSNVQSNESVNLPDGRKLFLEFRYSQSDFNQRRFANPYFRFEPSANTIDKISIRNIKSGASLGVSYNGVYTSLNKDFIGPTDFILCSDVGAGLDDGFFILHVEVETQVEHSLSDLRSSQVNSEEKLLEDLDSIMKNKKVSDFTYRVNDREFPVHKMMLAARSPVFMEMFSTEFKTSAKGVIDDISEEAFEDFLRFIYTGKVEIVMKHAKELLMISDKYEVKDLKAHCELYLQSNLNADVAVDVFQCAHKFRCDVDLKKAAFEHIKTSLAEINVDVPDEIINTPNTPTE